MGVLLTLAWSVQIQACASPSEEETASEDSRLTLQNGAKYVVNANATRIVLKKEVDGRPLEVKTADLPGKAILIYPVDKTAEQGVFSWARKVREVGANIEIDAEPIGLEELRALTEKQIVRIYMNDKFSKLGGQAPRLGKKSTQIGPLLSPLSGSSLRPRDLSGAFTSDPITASFGIDLTPSVDFSGSVTPTIDEFSVAPDLLINSDDGLELGAKLDFATDVSLAINGTVKQKELIAGKLHNFFDVDQDVVGRWVLVPIAGVPVPFWVGLSIGVSCGAAAGIKVDATLKFHLGLHASGSFVLDPDREKPVEDWIHEGQWKNELSADAKLLVDGQFDALTSLSCFVPSVKLSLQPVGKVTGVYITAGAVVALAADGKPPALSAALKAGIFGNAFGKSATGEVTLLKWTP